MENTQYDPLSPHAEAFINHEEIMATLAYADKYKNDRATLDAIMQKARLQNGLTHREAAVLLACDDPQINQQIFALAKAIKQAYYGNRVVLFAPLYISNYCVNGCTYCPYHLANKHMPRKKMNQDEIREEAVALQKIGHKRLAIELGEDPVNNPIEYVLESIKNIYASSIEHSDIDRLNVNIAATTVENFAKLKAAGIGTYILFQETYHKEAYEKLHPTGPKHDYAWHTEAMDRAMQGGIDDVGIGVLFGLDTYRYEFTGLLMHAEHLKAVHNVGPHTISVPRLRAADGINPADFNCIDDDIFTKIIALLRISVPYTGMIISTRESQKTREKALELGISQISGGSKTSIGGYSHPTPEDKNSAQFDVVDNRPLDEVVHWLLQLGYIPSFCTACYRAGRTGEKFMSICENKQIHHFCQPNALMSLQEYLTHRAKPETRQIGEKVVDAEVAKLPSPLNNTIKERIVQIRAGNAKARDFYV